MWTLPIRTPSSVTTILCLLIAVALWVDRQSPSAGTSKAGQIPPGQATEDAPTSLNPDIVVRGASGAQEERLGLALDRFSDAGLELPNLEVRFSNDIAMCGGSKGRFTTSTTPWRISICSHLDPVYEHELAHAWARANLSDETREQFMELRGYKVWSSKEVPWNERGVEGVAFIIQQGLNGLAVKADLSSEHRSRLAAFQMLTGSPTTRTEAPKSQS